MAILAFVKNINFCDLKDLKISKLKEKIPIEKIIYTQRKSIALHITENASLIIRAPYFTNQHTINNVIERHYKWIVRKRTEILKLKSSLSIRKFIDGEKYLYLGKYFKLKVTDIQDNKLVFDEGFFLGRHLLPQARKVFMKWYIDKAYDIIPKRVCKLALINNFKYRQVKITQARKRWGSCSIKGNLNFPWKLVMAPLQTIDYVIIHELVHLEIKNHSKEFWRRVESIMPDYKKHQQWLKVNQYKMVL